MLSNEGNHKYCLQLDHTLIESESDVNNFVPVLSVVCNSHSKQLFQVIHVNGILEHSYKKYFIVMYKYITE